MFIKCSLTLVSKSLFVFLAIDLINVSGEMLYFQVGIQKSFDAVFVLWCERCLKILSHEHAVFNSPENSTYVEYTSSYIRLI
jgi:hypothetical protein